MTPIIIKGSPSEKWTEVQKVQEKPFIYIMANGSKWAGQEPDDIDILLEVLSKYKLREGFGEYFTDNPCQGIPNPKWEGSGSDSPRWIDGPPLYKSNVVRFWGNFVEVSHVFHIDTNDEETISKLKSALLKNRNLTS